jgi:hypothetical protein
LPTSGPDAGNLNAYNLAGSADVIVDLEGYYVTAS